MKRLLNIRKRVVLLIGIVIVGVLVIGKSINLMAMSQTTLETNYNWDNNTGWKYSPKGRHMGSKITSYYAVSESVRALYDGYVQNGISLWGTYISMSYSSAGEGYIYAVNDSTSRKTAITTTYANSDGIITGWNICINAYYFDGNSSEGKKRTLAHEIGHVYGLGDLDKYEYASQIMYGVYSESKNVTSNDKNGMSVVTESHTHSGFYPQIYEDYLPSYHKVRCATCRSYKLEVHTSTTYCSKCGYSE